MQQVERSLAVAASADDIWAVAGDFFGFGRWHPGVTECVRETGSIRRLTLPNGGVIREQRTDRGVRDHAYSYTIIESPLPLKRHGAELSVTPDGDRSRIDWRCTFEAEPGAEDAVAAVFDEVFRDGLQRIDMLMSGKTGTGE